MISVVVAIYNVENYLCQCIESLISQTYTDIEIILVDDGSLDQSGIICDEYGKQDSRVRVIHKKNGGAVSARKAGLREAKGEYITCIDGDDWLESEMYERMLQKLENENVDVVMCGRYEDTGMCSREVYQGIKEGRYGKEQMLDEVYPKMLTGAEFFEWGIFPSTWDKLFRKECLYGWQMKVDNRIKMGDDAACVYPCLLCADSIYIMHECFYHYRQTVSSMIKQVRQRRDERNRYRILFHTVNQIFTEYAGIYDLREQWVQYLLFLMIPRADTLYQDIEELDYLFPFPNVKKHSRIILYCAGTYGQRLYHYLKRTGFCEIIAWVDQNYKELRKQGLSVESPGVIHGRSYDAIVIANMFAKVRKEIYRNLKHRYHVSNVYMPDDELITSEDTARAFGLMD
ncbi:MAG: glycosyltransferase [Lachnospiraceae bacterium]